MNKEYKETLDSDIAEFMTSATEERKSKKTKESHKSSGAYKLGEVIANGVRYFGQEKAVKRNRTAMCVCPACGELWRVPVLSIEKGLTKTCGCSTNRGPNTAKYSKKKDSK